MTWQALVEKLRTSVRVVRDEEKRVVTVWDVPGPSPTAEEVWLYHGEVQGVPWLIVTAHIFERARMTAEDALRHNSEMATGAIVLIGEHYVVRHAVPLPTLDWNDLLRAMQVLAVEAVRLRRAPAPAPPSSAYDD